MLLLILVPLIMIATMILIVASLLHRLNVDIGRLDAELQANLQRILEEDARHFHRCVESMTQGGQPFAVAFPNLLNDRATLLPEGRPAAPAEWDIDDLRRLQCGVRDVRIRTIRNAMRRRAAYFLVPLLLVSLTLEAWLYLRLSPVKVTTGLEAIRSQAAAGTFSSVSFD